MPTSCNIEIFDRLPEGEILGAILYHPREGYPSFMYGKLSRFLEEAYRYLKDATTYVGGEYAPWESQRVASVLIALSIEDYDLPIKPFTTVRRKDPRPAGGLPVFVPSIQRQGDIEYVWRVSLWGEKSYEITCSTAHGERIELPECDD